MIQRFFIGAIIRSSIEVFHIIWTMTDLLVERVKSQITQFSGSSAFNWCFMIVANVRAQSSIGSKLAFVSPKQG